MDSTRSLTLPGGLQDWFTDLDGWICQFSANVKVSRSQSKREENANLDSCKNCSQEQRNTKNKLTPETSPATAIKLHEIIVNGLIFSQNRDKITIEDFLSFFKENEHFTYYDFILTTVRENGRKSIQKYTRSKI